MFEQGCRVGLGGSAAGATGAVSFALLGRCVRLRELRGRALNHCREVVARVAHTYTSSPRTAARPSQGVSEAVARLSAHETASCVGSTWWTGLDPEEHAGTFLFEVRSGFPAELRLLSSAAFASL